jgi:mannitol/fructose-specific phosphotransferase system IIA component (Ntr-type)
MTLDIAINDSLIEMKSSLTSDQQMIRNIRTMLVKNRQLDRVTALKNIEEAIENLLRTIEGAQL